MQIRTLVADQSESPMPTKNLVFFGYNHVVGLEVIITVVNMNMKMEK